MVRRLLAFSLGLSLLGCSPAGFRDSADLQVSDLLRDRENSTLGYTPKVDVPTTIPSSPTRRAYGKVPTSPIPPASPPPLEAHRAVPSTQPLGPDIYLKDGAPAGALKSIEIEPGIARSSEPRPLGPPLPSESIRSLDLMGVIEYAASNSRDYRTQMEELYLAALDVTLQRHLLSPRPFVTQSFTYAGGQKDVNYNSAMTAVTAAGVRQKLPYGGEIVVQSLVQFVDALHGNVEDGESANLALSGSIPLLRGAGMVNLEPLINSERQVIYRVRTFEDYRRSFVVDISSGYFRLLQQQQSVANRRLNLVNMASLTERTTALYEAGRLSFLEVQRAMQSQLSAENDLINAEDVYRAAIDDFKVTIGMPVTEPLEIVPVELDVRVPRISGDDAVALATRYRLSLKTAADQIEDAHRAVGYAENDLMLPQVDLTAQANTGNTPGQPASAINSDTSTYSAGVTIDLPVDRLGQRNTFRRALITYHRAQRNFVTVRERIASDVRESLRAIRNAEESVRIQRQGIALAQRRLEFSNELLRQGKVQARDVVESQSSLLDAQDRFEQARSQLQIRLLQYLRDTGTLRVDPDAGSIGRAMDVR